MKRRHWDMSCWQDLGETNAENLISCVWPGGYPVVYVDPEDESEGLCADTVRKMVEAGEWTANTVDSYTHYEGPPVECTCGKQIESAYGDPESMNKPIITEAQAEKMADQMVWKRLARDRSYGDDAESIEISQMREHAIAEEVWEYLISTYNIG
jgi:hypothetical protein